MESYTEEYYECLQEGAQQSAQAIVPLVLDVVQPHRVVDVGCGVGTWLNTFMEEGTEHILGVDGPWVDTDLLCIPQDVFHATDLTEPFHVDQAFDLVVSLEVAEHLPADCANTFVDTLTRLGPVVLFSAAVPFQGGTRHVNEQWPAYWIERFSERGYVAVDALRPKIWDDERVAWWYAQNIFFFVQEECLTDYPPLKKRHDQNCSPPLSVVHPKNYLQHMEEMEKQVMKLEGRVEELGAWGSALQEQLAEREKQVEALWELRPGHMPLGRVLRALPRLIRHALVQRIKDVTFWSHKKWS